MVTFDCDGCGALVFFESVTCVACGRQLVPADIALNSLNRGLGLPDLYPYVLAPKAIEKLRLVHEVITAARTGPRAAGQT